MSIQLIEMLHKRINDALFTTTESLDYEETTGLILALAHLINTTETDEFLWCCNEGLECALDDLIVGAFWFYEDNSFNTVNSVEFALAKALGRIYTPNFEVCDEENPVYARLYEIKPTNTKEL